MPDSPGRHRVVIVGAGFAGYQRYEIGLHALLGAVQTLEKGPRPGDGPPPEPTESS